MFFLISPQYMFSQRNKKNINIAPDKVVSIFYFFTKHMLKVLIRSTSASTSNEYPRFQGEIRNISVLFS